MGEAVNSRSISMGWGVGWSAMADMADEESLRSSSGGRLSGCESRSYLDERLDEYELERRSRSRSLTREWDFLSGDEGGVPGLLFVGGLPGASLGTSGCADLEDLRKREGSTMRGERTKVRRPGVTEILVRCSQGKVWLRRARTEQKTALGSRESSSTFCRSDSR